MKRLLLVLFSSGLLCAQTAVYPAAVATNQDLLVAKDRSQSTLTAGINDSTLTVPVASGAAFTAFSAITIDNEQMVICSISSNDLTICAGTRGFNGTAAASHSSAAAVRANVTSWHHNALREEIIAIETALGANLDNTVSAGTGITITGTGPKEIAVDTSVTPQKNTTNTFAEMQTFAKGVNVTASEDPDAAGECGIRSNLFKCFLNTTLETMMTNPFTTRGDLVIQGASGPTRLAAGAAGTVLTGNGAGSDPSFQVFTSADVGTIQSGAYSYCVGTSGTDAYTCNLTPAITSYTAGMVVLFKPDVNNTGAATITINGIAGGAKAIKVLTSGAQADPADDVLDANGLYLLRYDGTVFLAESMEGGSGGGAPTTAAYITTQAEAGLSAEVSLGALADNSIVAVDVAAAVATPRAAASSDVIATFNGGTCSGYLKSDGTCDTPSVGSSVKLVDSNGADVVLTTPATTPVNEFTLKNAATAASPEIQATGDDTNIGIDLIPKGTGVLRVLAAASEDAFMLDPPAGSSNDSPGLILRSRQNDGTPHQRDFGMYAETFDETNGTAYWLFRTRLDGGSWSNMALFGSNGDFTTFGKFNANAAVRLSNVQSPSQLTANTDNFAGMEGAGAIRFSTDASRNLTGIEGGEGGRWLMLHNVGVNPLVLVDDATSTAANRFQLGGDMTLGADEATLLMYDATDSRWRSLLPSVLGVPRGGTGATSLNGIVKGTGTGPLTASQIATSDVADAQITPAKLSAAARQDAKSINIFSPVTGDTNKVQLAFANAVTLTRVWCSVDAGTSVTIQFDERAEATPNTAGTNVLTSSLVCDTNTEATTSFSNATIAANVPMNLQITAVSGAVTAVRIHVAYQID